LGASLFIWGHFFNLGANMFVEFEKCFLIGGIFFKIGAKWGQMC